ncbi:MAG: DUF86 domain-containing protein [Microbacteriaceae bacterium]|nr:DUF86 domain-containing protein [Microbacteriaceae bacterium]
MTASARTDRWLADLRRTLESAASLAARGRAAYDADEALRLAFEALVTRVGELAKRLVAAGPARFSDGIWSLAARQRDFVAHHYDRIDHDALWLTVTNDFPRLAAAVALA